MLLARVSLGLPAVLCDVISVVAEFMVSELASVFRGPLMPAVLCDVMEIAHSKRVDARPVAWYSTTHMITFKPNRCAEKGDNRPQ
jgi:hypothetical protein